jgi:hypothetical protein
MTLFGLAYYPDEGTDIKCGLFVLSMGSLLAIFALSVLIWLGLSEELIRELMLILSVPWFARADNQHSVHRGDRVGDVPLGPDRRRRGVGNRREWQVSRPFRYNEVVRSENPASRALRSGRARSPAWDPGNRAGDVDQSAE